MTAEQIYEIEHTLLGEASVWERESAEEAQKLAYYNEGVHDMASFVVAALKKGAEGK